MVSLSLAQRPPWWVTQIPGSAPSLAAHWASPVHGAQALLAQIGFAGSLQSPLPAHSTQRPLALSQAGKAESFIAQAPAAWAHDTQAPVAALQAGRCPSAVQSSWTLHSTQRPLAPSQIGRMPSRARQAASWPPVAQESQLPAA